VVSGGLRPQCSSSTSDASINPAVGGTKRNQEEPREDENESIDTQHNRLFFMKAGAQKREKNNIPSTLGRACARLLGHVA
jgi:hypothetical protein